jgi:hypothetical protein
MNKNRLWLAVLILVVVAVLSVGATEGAPETTQLKIQKALGVTDAPDVHKIPVGSTITHLPDGSTEVTGPHGKLVISVKSSEVGLVATPEGMARADHVFDFPSGSFVHGASANTIEIYNSCGELLFTVIDQAGEAGLEAAPAAPAAYPDGWVEYARWNGPGSFGHLYGEWTVPTTPQYTSRDTSAAFLFDGIQGAGANQWAGTPDVILQPVIEYNQDGAIPGNLLLGRVWVVRDGTTDYGHTDPITVSVGDTIIGAMTYNTGQHFWMADIHDLTTGQLEAYTTDLLGTTSQFVCTTLEGKNLDTDSDLFATTDFVNLQVFDQNGGTIYPSWTGVIDQDALDCHCFNNLGVIIYDSSHVRLRTNRVPSGGGCPFLQVWDGSKYVNEGLLNIYDAEGADVTYEHALTAVPQPVNGAYEFRLIEHPKTVSDIDQVQLHAQLEDGTIVELPLILAQHSENGDVSKMLLNHDGRKVEEKGADYNGGTSQSIDLKFAALGTNIKAVGFILTIEGNNPYSKQP